VITVPTTTDTVRSGYLVHDFVMVNSLRDTHAAKAASAQGCEFPHDALDS
jgi:hypothetical protein